MTHNRVKGRAAENQFKIVMESWAYGAIEQARPTIKIIGPGRFISSQNDFFGEFDLIGKRKDGTMYVQVKHDSSDMYKARVSIREFMRLHGCPSDVFVVAEKIPRKGFVCHFVEADKFNQLTVDLKGKPLQNEEVKE